MVVHTCALLRKTGNVNNFTKHLRQRMSVKLIDTPKMSTKIILNGHVKREKDIFPSVYTIDQS